MLFFVTVIALKTPLTSSLILSALSVFFCFEFLAKQATYIWNDIRDFKQGAEHPHKKRRCIAKYSAITFGKKLFISRVIITFVLSSIPIIIWNLWFLPILLVVTFFWQYYYDVWAKRKKFRKLIFTAFGYLERVLAAVLVIMFQQEFNTILLLLLIIWMISFAFVFGSACYWADQDYKTRMKGPAFSDSSFSKASQRTRKIASIFLFLSGAGIALIYSNLKYQLLILIISMIVVVLIILFVKSTIKDKLRIYLLLGIVSISVINWIVSPMNWYWYIFSIEFPIFLILLYSYLSYENMYMLNVIKGIKEFIFRADQILFGKID